MGDNSHERRVETAPHDAGDQGFMLLGLIVAIFIITLTLSVAAADVAKSLRREREVESARRANQYVRAIRLYYTKFHHYPGSVDQLENTNTIRFLRKRYVDPLTGKDDYRLILFGQNQTTVKGFFGAPLAGLAGTGSGGSLGLGTAATTATAPGGTGSAFGSSSFGSSSGAGGGNTGTFSMGGAAGAAGTGSTAGAPGTSGTGTGTTGTSGAPGTSGTTSTATASSGGDSLTNASGPFVGVGSSAVGPSILEINGQKTYETWEFLYDPGIEKLKAAAALNAGASSAGALGQSAPGSSIGGAPGPGGSATPGSTPGSTPGGSAPTGSTSTPQP